jgi:hypothetical protein
LKERKKLPFECENDSNKKQSSNIAVSGKNSLPNCIEQSKQSRLDDGHQLIIQDLHQFLFPQLLPETLDLDENSALDHQLDESTLNFDFEDEKDELMLPLTRHSQNRAKPYFSPPKKASKPIKKWINFAYEKIQSDDPSLSFPEVRRKTHSFTVQDKIYYKYLFKQ